MPKRTIELLDQLSALGFSDNDFRVIHHFAGEASITGMRGYCDETDSFRNDGTNQRVRERLKIVLAAFAEGGFSRRKAGGVSHAVSGCGLRSTKVSALSACEAGDNRAAASRLAP
jgi:hypothetical protein